MNLSDRIALFRDGRIEQVGTPEQLYQAPETLFAARFLGDSNVFELGAGATGGDIAWGGRHWVVDPGTVAAHPGVRERAAVVVRPEDVGITRTSEDVPTGANWVEARVRDLEFMGSYRTAVLGLGAVGAPGRARIPASEAGLSIGEDVHMWWRPERQRLVAA